MKKGFAYTLGFMVVLSAVLTFLLAFAYESFKPSIAANAQLSEQRALLDAFDRAQGVKDQDIPALYDSLIKPGGKHSRQCPFNFQLVANMHLPVDHSAKYDANKQELDTA